MPCSRKHSDWRARAYYRSHPRRESAIHARNASRSINTAHASVIVFALDVRGLGSRIDDSPNMSDGSRVREDVLAAVGRTPAVRLKLSSLSTGAKLVALQHINERIWRALVDG